LHLKLYQVHFFFLIIKEFIQRLIDEINRFNKNFYILKDAIHNCLIFFQSFFSLSDKLQMGGNDLTFLHNKLSFGYIVDEKKISEF
jgi:hypothetical protein